ncbi:uncharacterized protein LOC110870207 [Helianthus annuus]|uniref:uncharacterized protein LOC110870207 n=1 Tax=Helianthus annuus TaxID=4232 RepID=UPI000B8FB984|nr:uncharacterized protein LOC110870207 [Helianthus annuus]
MSYPDHESISSSNNRLINEELSYDQNTMENELNSMLVLLIDEQRHVFYQIMESVRMNKCGVFFLYGYGGTALDRTLKDILMPECSNSEALPFGGKTRYRQRFIEFIIYMEQMQVTNANKKHEAHSWHYHGDIEKTREFAKWLLDIGEGKVGVRNDGEAVIDIPEKLLITDSTNPIGSLINFVYPSILESFNDPNYF